jgi:hypothetical protein
MDDPVVPKDDAPSPVQEDSKPQFRTYASDVAKLTGKPLSSTVQNTPAPIPTTPAPPPPAKIIPKAPTTEESREAVLERLRAKAAGKTPATPAAPAPTPPPPAPSTAETREEVLKRLQKNAVQKSTPAAPVVAAPAPVAPPLPQRPATPVGILPLAKKPEAVQPPATVHTYKSDFSEKAKTEHATPISILAAEQNARGTAPAPRQLKTPKKNYLPMIAGAVALLLAGGASIYFSVLFVTGRPPIIVAPSVPSLIFADVHRELKGTGLELQQGLSELTNENLPEGGVAVAYVTYASTTGKNTTVMLPAEGGALISGMGLSAPEILLRNVEPQSTVGVVRADAETYPFFMFRVASYERTFAGMLQWESTIARDLSRFYPEYPAEAPLGTTTATSTASAPVRMQRVFVDAVIDNHDVRVLKDEQGRQLMLYGYRDKETLIIARSEKAFSELLARLSSTRSN